MRLEKLSDVSLQQLIRHAKPASRVENFLGEIETILAVQVAY
jgi:hypothetical protein